MSWLVGELSSKHHVQGNFVSGLIAWSCFDNSIIISDFSVMYVVGGLHIFMQSVLLSTVSCSSWFHFRI